MKGYIISIKSTLLDPKHVKAMGESVWLFIWILDKMTATGDKQGVVLFGRPVKFEEVKKNLGLTYNEYRYWLDKLRTGGYITTKKTAVGLIFTVNKAWKMFGLKAEASVKQEQSDVPVLADPSPASATGLQTRYKQTNNIQEESNEVALSPTKSESWIWNKKFLEDNKEKYSDERFNFPNKDGLYTWVYPLNHGKCSPGQMFIAYYWRDKEKLSEGRFSYKFSNKEKAIACMMSEKKNAEALANMMTIREFTEKMEAIDEKAFDEQKRDYWMEWKLSTVLKNLHSGQ